MSPSAHQDRRQQLHAADADIAAGRVEAERPALHPVGIEERDIGHAGGEIAAAEAGRRGDQQHQPERRVGLGDEIGERHRRDEQHRRAEDRPVAAAERRHREGVGKPHQRADQPGQRDELKQLVGRVVESRPAAAWWRRCSRSARPRSRDARRRSTRSGCGGRSVLPLRFPERLVFGAPIRNPGRELSWSLNIPSRLTAASLQALPPATEARAEAKPRWRVHDAD